MPGDASGWFEKIQWGWTALGAALGWCGTVISGFLKRKRKKTDLINLLLGLPPECKVILADFRKQGTHTMRTDPLSPPMNVLSSMGITELGPGGGTYDAVNRYVTIRPDIWEVMDDWLEAEDARRAQPPQ